jgi:hypothetical protein
MTRLFIANADLLLEEDPSITPVRVDCMSYVREKLQEHVISFYHPSFGNPSITQWPSRTEVSCLHCCESFETVPVPTVRRYDELKNIYYVYGIYCSVNCAKSALIECESSLSTTRLLYFNHMCRSVFGIKEAVPPAPPRIRLQRFGGDLSIEQFRTNFKHVKTAIIEPPFIQSSVICEDHKSHSTTGDATIITGDSSSSSYSGGMYSQFLMEKKDRPVDTQSFAAKKKRKKKNEEDVNGGLDAFLTYQKK